ncbi:Lrp/AsnC family transcriptional regulator [Streptomyces sp. G-G2]|uniref:Lrp/AsnC family transcriptional regulator n=1 Tax=Streptomyces sp. G-G2 TaxID=3046201 RepID=UPI0024BB682D|nr:Lrp/AsnC family transcriptional regulator [Streptomyces sp. G-G2]MDJ0384834.1 Lrp/AsnC family transcriptional regulator [Streptomyces sp. G-G2]
MCRPRVPPKIGPVRENAGKTQESNPEKADPPDSSTERPSGAETALSEQDLALIDALQSAPRAPWSRIGHALGVDATTAARRWERLRAAGLAWATAYDSARAATVAFVEVRCQPGRMEEVSATAAALPWVFSVYETVGDFDLLLSVAAVDPLMLSRSVHRVIGGLPGVRSLRIRLGITLYGEGGDWRIRAMEPAGRAGLSHGGVPSRTAYGAHGGRRLSPEDQALLDALGADCRLGYTALGAAAGMGDHAARRRVQRMLKDGDITLRCDLALPLAGLPTMVVYRASVPHARLEATGSALARLEQVRLCASVSGPDNLHLQVLLHGLGGVDPFEAVLADRVPALEIKDRTVTVHTVKRVGWLLDDRGRATGRVPTAAPEL